MTLIDTDERRAQLDSLTGLRFIAAFVVLLRHTLPEIFPLPGLLELSMIGPIGVGFFFVLSGFILTWNWEPGRPRRGFYLRRAARIAPLHVLTTVAAAVLLILAGTPLWASSILSLILVQAWLTEEYRLGGNSPSWSLSVEAFFYAVFPFIVRPLARLSIRKSWWAIAAAMLLMIVWTAGYGVAAKVGVPFLSAFSGYTNPVYRLGEFVIGVALATAMRRGWRPKLKIETAAWIALGGYVLLAALNATVDWLRIRLGDTPGLPLSVLDLLYLPFTVMLIACAAGSDIRGDRSAFRTTPMVRLGQWSFALYLVQAIVITLAVRLVTPGELSWQGGTVAAGVILISIALSAGLFHWFEKPLERALRRRFAPSRLALPRESVSR
jgi:peptidoglycan/LPS O-acetylase OafA/YrhL